MNVHQNARLTPRSRAELVRRVLVEGQAAAAVACHMGVSIRTVAKWLARYRSEGEAGLADRSSLPRRLHRATPSVVIDKIEALRRERLPGKQIALETGVSPATVSRVLQRLGISRMRDLEPAEPVRRYQREHPGELIHIDIKKFGRFDRVGHRITGDRTGQSNSRGIGWEFVHVCIDDASRVAFSQIMADEEGKRHGLPPRRGRLLCRLRHHRHTRHDRQRFMLQKLRLPQRLQGARPRAHPNQALHPKDQRKRPNASSRPACANGLTLAPIKPPNSAKPNCPAGSINTTGIGRMAAYTIKHPSVASA